MRLLVLGDEKSVHIQRWVQELTCRGYIVKVLDMHRGPRWLLPLSLLSLYLRGCLSLITFRPQIVNAHYVSSYGVVAAFLPFDRVVQTCWGSDILVTAKASVFGEFLVKLALKRARLIFADAQVVLTEVAKLAGENKSVVLMNWGVDTERLPVARFADGPLVFVSIRNWELNYNVDVIISSFEELIAEGYSDARLLVFGSGSLAEQIADRVVSSRFSGNIELIGKVDFAKLADLLSGAHVSVTIPDSDAVAASLLEAMGIGLYVIASDLPANREWLSEETGTFVEKNDVSSLKDAMSSVVRMDRNELKRKGEINRRKVLANADRKKQFDNIDSCYRRLI